MDWCFARQSTSEANPGTLCQALSLLSAPCRRVRRGTDRTEELEISILRFRFLNELSLFSPRRAGGYGVELFWAPSSASGGLQLQSITRGNFAAIDRSQFNDGSIR